MAETRRRLGKYHLLEKIGAGGMAEVFRARRIDDGAGTDYAIKQLSEDLSRDPLLVSMFVDEARLASQLRHANIVQLVEFGTDENGRVFMVMEFVDGRDLRWCLAMSARAQYWLPVEFSLTVARDLCRALGYAHRARAADGTPLQIVHRDVSHSNVFLSKKGESKLADFGIARAQGRQSKTRTGLVKGKLGYLSPEQVRAERLDGRSDLFSASVVLWELLTQRRMFVGETEFKTMVAVCTERRIPSSKFRPGLPQAIDDLCLRGVAIDRNDRFANAEEMEQTIERVAAELRLRLGAPIVGQVLSYLDDCARSYAPEEAARAALADERVAPEEALAGLDKQVTRTPTPSSEEEHTGSFPVLTGDLPSDSFAVSWADPDRTVTEDPDEKSATPSQPVMVDFLASRDLDSGRPDPGQPLPSSAARERSAELVIPEAPTYFRGAEGEQRLDSFEALLRALDPRTAAPDDAVSADRAHWMPADRFGLLAGFDFMSLVADIRDPLEQGGFAGAQLVAVLGNLALNGFTGRLLVERGPHRYGVLLEVGGIVGMASDRAAHQLPAVLTAAKLIPDSKAMNRALHEILARDRSLDEVLEQSYGIPRERAEGFRQATVRELFEELLALGDGRFAYERTGGWPGRQFLTGTALELVLPVVSESWSSDRVDALLAPLERKTLRIAPGFALVARMLRLRQDAAPVLREMQAGRSVGELLARFPAGTEPARLARRLSLILIETGALLVD